MAPPNNQPPPRPMSFAERAAARKPLTEEERAEIREEFRREADLVSAMIEKYGHPFDGLETWWSDTDEALDAA